MFKIIIMALLIFIGMVGYDNLTDKAQQDLHPSES